MNNVLLAAIFVAQAAIGIVGTLAVYKALEVNWRLGWVTGLALVSGVVLAEWRLGETLLTVTVDEMQAAIVVAVIASLVGVVSTVVLARPDLERRTPRPEVQAVEHSEQ